jgi:hypothetical protein
VFGIIKRELQRRSAIEPVIGHMKTDGHLGRCHLKGREGDAANVILTAVGHAAPNPARSVAGVRRHPGSQMGFLTADSVVFAPG